MKQNRQRFNIQYVTACISTTLVLLLLGMVIFFVLSAHNLSVYVRENINFSLLLSDEMKDEEATAFQQKLEEERYVKETLFISKEEALKEQTEAMGSDPEEFLGHNPFTASIEIKLHAAYANGDSIAWIEEELRRNPNVKEIVYPQALVEAVNANIRKISLLLLGVAALLTLVSFVLINNTIQLTIYAKRFVIHTMKLVGASWGFIRAPFIRRNLVVGLIAAVAANLLLMSGAQLLLRYEPQLGEVITRDVLLWMALAVTLFGVTITTLCAYVSISKYLRMKAAEIYYV